MPLKSPSLSPEKPASGEHNFDGALREFLRTYPEIRQSLKDLKKAYPRREWSEGSLEFISEVIPGGFSFILESMEEKRNAELKQRFQSLMRNGHQLTSTQLEDLVGEVNQKNEEYLSSFEKILHRYTQNFLDNGLDASKTMTHPESGEKVTRAPVAMLNRAGFFQKLEEKVFDEKGEYNGRALTVLNADITKLRSADLVKDKLDPNNQISYADLLLQDTARAFAELVKNLDRYLPLAEGVEVEVGRYGGDEFVFSIVGDETGEVALALQALIKKRIELIEAYYLDESTATISRQAAALKNDAVEVYAVPNDATRREIFLHYLRQGLVFDTPQIEAVRDRFRDAKGREDVTQLAGFLQREKQNQTIYPEKATTLTQKMQYLLRKHPLDGAMMLRAHLYDRKHNTETAVQVLEVIERVLYDSLLRARVQDFTRFKQDLADQKYRHVWGFDMKFIKEINDNVSYADADLAIRTLWEQITAGLSEQDQEALTFSRRGGTYFVALNRDSILSLQGRDHLDSLRSVKILDSIQNKEGTEIPLGTTQMSLDFKKDGELTDVQINAILCEFFENMDVRMYNKLLEEIGGMDLEKINQDHLATPRSYSSLTYKFFTGKRKQERLNKLIGLVTQKKTRYQDPGEIQIVLKHLDRLRGYSSLPEKKVESKSRLQTGKSFMSGKGFNFNTLEHFQTVSFANYPLEIQVLALLSFANGPQTTGEINRVLPGEEIPSFVLQQIIYRFDHFIEWDLATGNDSPIRFTLPPTTRSLIRQKLCFDENALAQIIFDGTFAKTPEDSSQGESEEG